jgi:hypothetical protein
MICFFTAEPCDNGWRVVCYFGPELFVSTRRFRTKATARAWARQLNVLAEAALAQDEGPF